MAEYHRLGKLGFFAPDEQVELIRGEIIIKAAKTTFHSVCNSLLLGELCTLAIKKAIVRGQEPIILSTTDSEPEPDVVIARNRSDRYLASHPEPADILLVIEVSDSTLKYDRETKLSLYAESGIANYWIFNLVDRQLEMHSEPYQKRQGDFNYRSQKVVLQNEAVVIPGFPDLSLDLSLVFPA
ncbi:MAG: Uma2 family endonuclease [Microcoleus sp. PH2017_29_MFU_D_A]|uniref:Uma2 family endonuclease n=1 Tax=unclassified Microcoleus TaxID=2642155 RepID=UPI001DAE7D46|nr:MULTISPECIES: Uma2 family endonuclease [unclassified Microcoleus]MCC3421406.1 Uma2 family endonuclease [Microcoleus sp. PH2017_07_MST_O_A]MCC3432341.1 Uma2 family endonuclease [Microcoleus sp. PH2017_04_SCI_O_A]MCC3443606.1 Uma2 family endonuclease [Microcoleus sp. PH2017_03_ELD_O_A]MCC3469491.1 Uma2 family endonuclease [Microcoleus sp. PH2017_06_SFM_O_A]MCC3505549.1 Uma2 family endonuclease [Microcoleus sp. PH2017_19_SFW_U_A]MCC3511065.1 Uma2 family endonuclease [Microcoleus sp. PH2017_17